MKRSQNILLIILLSCAFSTGLGSADIVIDNSKTTDAVMRGGAYADLLQEDAGSDWTPADLPDIIDWWRADDVASNITKDGDGYVSSWKGSINSIDLAQATEIKQPQWLDAQLNGYPAIKFDGDAFPAGDYLQGAFDSTYAQPNTFILVCSEPTDNNDRRVYFDGDDALNEEFLYYDGRIGQDTYKIGAGSSKVITYPLGTGFKIFTCVFNQASSIVRVDGVDYSPVGDVGSNSLDGLILGANPVPTYYADISVTDLIFVNAALTVPQMQAIEARLTTRYAL